MMLFLLSACSEEESGDYHYLFTGDGEKWEAQYEVEGTAEFRPQNGRTYYHHEYEDQLTVTYKGPLEEIESIETFEYSYETASGGGGVTKRLENPLETTTFTMEGSGTGAGGVRKNEKVKVYIKWDNEEETIELVQSNR